jgi:FlaA1/EpsC-like NDP-sugar epimerase
MSDASPLKVCDVHGPCARVCLASSRSGRGSKKPAEPSNAELIAQRVLVTGGLGYIGSHVVVSLLLTGRYQPIVLDNGHNAQRVALDRCAEIARDEMG